MGRNQKRRAMPEERRAPPARRQWQSPKIFIGLIYLFVCLKAWGGAFGIGSVTQYVGAITALSGGLAKIA